MLDPLNWRRLVKDKEHWQIEAPEGQWTIQPPHSSTVQIKFGLPFPEGVDWSNRSDWLREAKEEGFSKEYQKRSAVWGLQEVAVTHNTDGAKLLVDLCRQDSTDWDSFDEALLSAGFGASFNYFTPAERAEGAKVYELRLPKGRVTAHIVDIPGERWLGVHYDSKNSRWSHPLLRISLEDRTYDLSNSVYTFWPEHCDPFKVGARYAVDYIIPYITEHRMDLLNQ